MVQALPASNGCSREERSSYVPYTSETGWCIVHFLGSASGTAYKPERVRAGQIKFDEINSVMEATRQSFKRAWKSSAYGDVEFKLVEAASSRAAAGLMRRSSAFIITRNGQKAAASEIEEVIMEHPTILDALALPRRTMSMARSLPSLS